MGSPRILLVKLSSLGDVIHAMPVLRDILAAFPQAEIDWVVEPGFAPLVRRVAGIHRVIECAQRRWRKRGLAGLWAADLRAEKAAFSQQLRETAYDWVIDLQGLTKSALVARRARLAPGGQRVALANKTDGSGYEAPTRWVADRAIRMPRRSHALDRSRLLVAQALSYPLTTAPDFGLRGRQPPGADRTVVFVHGTSRDDKLWPESRWVALGQALQAEGWRIALPQGSDVEQQRAQRLAQAIGPEGCDLWPRMSLDELLDRMGTTQGVIGVDSGLSHLAVALGLPHVQLYNFPTAWRTGPQPAHGHHHQVSVGGDQVPTLAKVQAAWAACTQAGLANAVIDAKPVVAQSTQPVEAATPGLVVKRWLALFAYDLLMHALAPLLWLRLLWRARAEPLYGERISERFGRYRSPPGGASAAAPRGGQGNLGRPGVSLGGTSSGGRLWLHAVSLGETRAAEPLLRALRAQRPGLRLLLTHGTATGREAGRALLAEGDRQSWLPLDLSGATQRFLQHHRPALGVLMETEVWPNLLCAAERAAVPMALANARLSDKSLRQALRFAPLLRPAVERIGLVLAQTEADAARLRQAGARQPQVCGNLKFDMTPDAALLARGQQWRAGLQRPVVLAAVWREGEDQPLLDAWAALPAQTRPLLVLVPRHPQRFDEVAALVLAKGLSLSRRSSWAADLPDQAATQAADVWLGDSMREMPAYYALADVVLLGGSFAPLGGQNLIEPAACGRVVVMGPHTHNFAEASRLAEQAGAAIRVPDLPAAVAEALRLLGSAERSQREAQASAFANAHRGAADRMASALLACLDQHQAAPTKPR